LAVASGWLFDGLCDSVLVAGVDALSLYIHAGFNGLGALAKHDARPFAADRDGLVLGEGAAVVVLETDETAKAPVLAELLGTGLSSDGTHMTAPDREGRGVSAAVERALSDAGVNPVDVDMVSVHGTATVFNDQMEAKALHRSFGGRPLPFHCVKHAIGHTLGAAGAIESSLIVYCLDRGVRPPPVTNVAPDCPLRPSPGTTAPPTLALSTNSAFGGHNAVAVFGRAGFSPSTLRERLPVPTRVAARAELILPPGKVDWASLWGDSPDRFRRMNRYVRAGMCVVNRLFESMDELPGDHCGIVLASEANCRISDTRYHGRLVHRGAAQAPRLEFIYTIPGSPAAEIAIHWGLLGPAMVLVAPIQEAVQAAERMIRWRQAERLIAVGIEAQDNTGPIEAVAALIEVGRGPVLY
jgi:3-oxoacyl-(acyl-carrier-protein) synthase